MRKLDYTTIFFALMGSFLVLFILIPIVNLMVSSDLNSIIANLKDSQVISSIFISVYSALAATLIAVLFGVPLAYILARHDFFGKGFVESIIDIPIVIPHTVSGIALLLSIHVRRYIRGTIRQIRTRFHECNSWNNYCNVICKFFICCELSKGRF